ncbi:hypothetical protein D3C74_457370 [compost metagenome]
MDIGQDARLPGNITREDPGAVGGFRTALQVLRLQRTLLLVLSVPDLYGFWGAGGSGT